MDSTMRVEQASPAGAVAQQKQAQKRSRRFSQSRTPFGSIGFPLDIGLDNR